jgi:hypothetical protein
VQLFIGYLNLEFSLIIDILADNWIIFMIFFVYFMIIWMIIDGLVIDVFD